MKGLILILISFFGLFLSSAHAQFECATNADNTLTITNYTGDGGAVIVPAEINGTPVSQIGDGAFEDTGITNLTIQSGISSIGIMAFYNCGNLSTIGIPDSVTNLGAYAFQSTGLISITIPKNLTFIPSGAFFGCGYLTNVVLGDKVVEIGTEAFFRCVNLADFSLPNSLQSIDSGAFYSCEGLESVIVPNGVANIGGAAFRGCGNLKKITLPNSLISLGDYAFGYCNLLSNVIIPAAVTNIGDNAFYECDSLGTVFFLGNAPAMNPYLLDSFYATAYCLPGTTGWDSALPNDQPIVWNPQIVTRDGFLGARNGQFGFNVSGNFDIPVQIQVCTNLAFHSWLPLQSFSLTNGSYYFSEPVQTNNTARFYRLAIP